MTELNTDPKDRSEVLRVMRQYIDAARSGKGDHMRGAFHCDATIFGYIGSELMAGPIEQLFLWNDQNGPAKDLEASIGDIDLVGSIATVRLDLENWTGHQFTDMFTLLKVGDQWKIINKVFHLHTSPDVSREVERQPTSVEGIA